MKNYVFDMDFINSRLQSFSEAKRLAFGIFLLERSIPEFLQFQVESDCVGGGGGLRAVLAQCWSALETGNRGASVFVALDACENVLPDSEEQTSLYKSAAIDAVNIACNMLDFLKTGDVHYVLESVTARRDTVDLFIQNNTDVDGASEGFEERVLGHARGTSITK